MSVPRTSTNSTSRNGKRSRANAYPPSVARKSVMIVIELERIREFLKNVTKDRSSRDQISRYASRLACSGQRSKPAAASACVWSDVTTV